MKINDICGEQIISKYLNPKNDFIVIHDIAYREMALGIQHVAQIKNLHTDLLEINDVIILDKLFENCIVKDCECILLVSEDSFIRFRLRKYLNFSYGAPRINKINKNSYVSIFPLESAQRIYSSDYKKDMQATESILLKLKDNALHKITTEIGTSITFISRKWCTHDNEILTAPLENSINGRIMVDGAVFYKKIENIVSVKIKNGLFVGIYAESENAKSTIDEYIKMTNHDFVDTINKQLAEVGIGFNTNAVISNCFMESETVFGTCHFCFGNNACYGGANKSDFHGASVLIKNPDITMC